MLAVFGEIKDVNLSVKISLYEMAVIDYFKREIEKERNSLNK
jgi:hypothetical protein